MLKEVNYNFNYRELKTLIRKYIKYIKELIRKIRNKNES